MTMPADVKGVCAAIAVAFLWLLVIYFNPALVGAAAR